MELCARVMTHALAYVHVYGNLNTMRAITITMVEYCLEKKIKARALTI